MSDTKEATIRVAEKLSEESDRLTRALEMAESKQAAVGIAALLLAASVEAQLYGVSLDTAQLILRGCWRETAHTIEIVEAAREHRKADDGSSN